MKSLTIEELEALEVGDWVWVIDISDCGNRSRGQYRQVDIKNKDAIMLDGRCYGSRRYADYGTKWLAYKNKEYAEAKGEIVEIGKYFIEPEQLPGRPLRYIICDYSLSKGVRDMCDTYEEAEARLQELRGEK